MPAGFKIQMSYDELRKHCLDRADYHTGRASIKAAELPKLLEAQVSMEKAAEAIKAASSANTLPTMNKNSYAFSDSDIDSQIKRLESDIRDHNNRALVFQFWATHLMPESYILEDDDMIRLEIIAR